MAKGIRVNQLAKVLGVESAAILAKCREEGLGEKVPNHMSVLSLGLAETVREWFSGGTDGGGGSTAVESAQPIEVAVKLRRDRRRPSTPPPETARPEFSALTAGTLVHGQILDSDGKQVFVNLLGNGSGSCPIEQFKVITPGNTCPFLVEDYDRETRVALLVREGYATPYAAPALTRTAPPYVTIVTAPLDVASESVFNSTKH